MTILASSPGLVPGSSTSTLWQRILADAVRDLDELCRLVQVTRGQVAVSEEAARGFPLLVPRGYLARIERGNPRDPLLLQVLPQQQEKQPQAGFVADPVGDANAMLTPGLLQKYAGRALIVATGTCAVHCRYCFRRNFAYEDLPDFAQMWESAAMHVGADDSIHEVILSGGDPLTLADDRLGRLATRLARIPHVRRLRIHTRLPILIPERVTDALLAWLTGTRLAPVMVIHANHAAELNDEVATALGRLVNAGIPVLNQTVLLRGVNDTVEALANLCERLVDLRVMPYYLHQLDRVAGAAHFEVSEAVGQRLIAALQARLPGYAIPRYVREIEGAAHKVGLSKGTA